jgi:hypothetical protein
VADLAKAERMKGKRDVEMGLGDGLRLSEQILLESNECLTVAVT